MFASLFLTEFIFYKFFRFFNTLFKKKKKRDYKTHSFLKKSESGDPFCKSLADMGFKSEDFIKPLLTLNNINDFLSRFDY